MNQALENLIQSIRLKGHNEALEKVKQAIEDIKAKSYTKYIDGEDWEPIPIVELQDVLEILDKLIEGEEE